MAGCYAVFHKQLGDLVLLEPALTRLRAHYGGEVALLTRRGHAPVTELMDGVRLQEGMPLVPKQHLYCFDPLNKSAMRALIAPAWSKTCILPEKREMAWFHRFIFGQIIVPELADHYVAKYFWDNIPVPSSAAFQPPRLKSPPEEWRPPGFDDAPFILLNATSGWKSKNWIPAAWANVIHAIHDSGGPRMIMTSATNDWQLEHCREIVQLAPDKTSMLEHGTTLKNFLWLCANARMILTVDGAAAHLAVAFGVPGLALFGATNIHNWHFKTERNHALRAISDKSGKYKMRNLVEADVIDAALDLWTLSQQK